MAQLTPPPDGSSDRLRGTNQVGVRLYNERLVLSIVRREGSLPKAEIARMSGLSAQTVSVIVKQLEQDGLLQKESKVRGKIGQPSVPFSLREEGAGAFGLKIGRRSAELVAVGLTGKPLGTRRLTYRFPTPDAITDFVQQAIDDLMRLMPAELSARIAGLGVAMPYELWKWPREMAVDPEVLDAWQTANMQKRLEAVMDWPVYVANDATAACGAELVFANLARLSDFVYFYVGAFVGGGVVLNGQLVTGRQGNAGALGSMLITANGKPRQLIQEASVYTLEHDFTLADLDASPLWQNPEQWPNEPVIIDLWLARAAPALAQAVLSAAAVIDFEAAVIDGAFPNSVRRALAAAVRQECAKLQSAGLSKPEIVEGGLGPLARVLGGATLPLMANFIEDRDVLFKDRA